MSGPSLTTGVDARAARQLGYGALAVLIVGILAFVPFATWHSAPSVDARTHIEMIRGVADHGFPYSLNGPVDRFPELAARWNVPREGKLWGNYPPLFDYVAAPFFAFGGLVAVSRFNLVLLAVFAWGVFVLGSRLLRHPAGGALAAWLAIVATPIPATSIDMSPYILAEALAIGSLVVITSALDGARPWSATRGAFGGLLAGAATAAHLLSFPILVGIVVAVAITHRDDESTVPFTSPFAGLEEWLPSKASFQRSAAVFAGGIAALVPVALLNARRFGSLNPLSYGPCVWVSCAETGQNQQTLSAMARFSGPTLLWIAATVGLAWYFRRDRRAVAFVVVGALALLLPPTTFRAHSLRFFAVAFGYVVDVTPFDFSPVDHAKDGIGVLLGPWTIRSLLQCTPLLVLAPLAPRATSRDRRWLALLGIPSLFALLLASLRANAPGAHAWGFPFVYQRYMTLAMTPLLLLALASVPSWKKLDALLAAGFAVVLIGVLLDEPFDTSLARRVFLLYGSLVIAGAAIGLTVLARRRPRVGRVAAVAVALALGCSVGTTVGVTIPAILRLRSDGDRRVDAVAAVTPARFAVAGFSPEIDTPLSLRASRDIEYLDLFEQHKGEGWSAFRSLIDVWRAEDRPIFALLPINVDIPSPWPDIAFVPVVPEQGIYRVVPR